MGISDQTNSNNHDNKITKLVSSNQKNNYIFEESSGVHFLEIHSSTAQVSGVIILVLLGVIAYFAYHKCKECRDHRRVVERLPAAALDELRAEIPRGENRRLSFFFPRSRLAPPSSATPDRNPWIRTSSA